MFMYSMEHFLSDWEAAAAGVASHDLTCHISALVTVGEESLSSMVCYHSESNCQKV
jgi:hypothetical protein